MVPAPIRIKNRTEKARFIAGMNSQQRKLKRLLNLTAVLVESRVPLTARQLRERVPDEAYSADRSEAAFRRTFERDKKDLTSIGVPIRVGEFAYGDPSVDHYSIDPEVYAERDLHFTPDELAALKLAARRVRLPGTAETFIKTGIPTEEEIASLDAAVDRSPGDSPDMVGELSFEASVPRLASAAVRRKAVKYAYRDSDGRKSVREVEPWRLSFTRGHWYLTGWDRWRRAERLYRVDRIQGTITETGRAAHPVEDRRNLQELKPWDFGTADPVDVRVLVDAPLASWAAQATGTDGEYRSDGSIVITLTVRNANALRSFVLSMLHHAEILTPRQMRDEMIAWLEAQTLTP